MDNAQIIHTLELLATLLELHEENPFKVKSYLTAAQHLEKVDTPLANLSVAELQQLPGIGKAIAEKIAELCTIGTFKLLEEVKQKTPAGLIELTGLSGIGTKKLRTLWQELNITDAEGLLQACEANQVAQLKGFGTKTQEQIRQALLFKQDTKGKLRLDKAAVYAQKVAQALTSLPVFRGKVYASGELRRQAEFVSELCWVAVSHDWEAAWHSLNQLEDLEPTPIAHGLKVWRGQLPEVQLKVSVHLVSEDEWVGTRFLQACEGRHLAQPTQTQVPLQVWVKEQPTFANEEAIYAGAGLPYIVPEMREGHQEWAWATQYQTEMLLETSDIKGVIHAHSTYSDGKHSLAQMAQACAEAGYQYLGITDHSQSAFYANGLNEARVYEQHREIDALNNSLAPFKIFKGIESDILADGSLDYPEDCLKSFDFIIASIHSGLRMDESKATQRLIKAIENPYTTILGHPTGRLLLSRQGYPVDFMKVIDACAANGVAIELNASPWRLDIPWQYIPYALEKGVKISINPDAHEQATIHDIDWGVRIARKAGLTKEATLNTLDGQQIANFFSKK
ncbi:DNA polymerase/3'-5' exonuclease PolX [Eisenibacter elegans]|uniref:DNA polymerase/3'-5' exonuclease PolX n=1 Tax=Eisenibacter elegans TaxID=997 RepID=UPI0003FE3253|nr:DNA polymerase/3'-5' exonuclease PolX [Eisenibacter elegans]